MPTITQGTQTSIMKNGCNTTVARKVFAFFAVIQCWNRCGNMPTDSGMTK